MDAILHRNACASGVYINVDGQLTRLLGPYETCASEERRFPICQWEKRFDVQNFQLARVQNHFVWTNRLSMATNFHWLAWIIEPDTVHVQSIFRFDLGCWKRQLVRQMIGVMIGCLKVVEWDKKLMSDMPTFEAIIPYNIQMNSNSGFIGVEIFVISSTVR